jgi:fructose/tagatose bisphosphate aldolase
MALIALRQLLDHAAERGYGVPVEEIQEGIRHGVRKVISIPISGWP